MQQFYPPSSFATTWNFVSFCLGSDNFGQSYDENGMSMALFYLHQPTWTTSGVGIGQGEHVVSLVQMIKIPVAIVQNSVGAGVGS